jgi:hypothetical protein
VRFYGRWRGLGQEAVLVWELQIRKESGVESQQQRASPWARQKRQKDGQEELNKSKEGREKKEEEEEKREEEEPTQAQAAQEKDRAGPAEEMGDADMGPGGL